MKTVEEKAMASADEYKITGEQNRTMFSSGYLAGYISAFSEESTANAHLIAASPELLDALHVCWASLKTYGDHPIIDKQCKLAINKALGL